jgi:hypothetical protein
MSPLNGPDKKIVFNKSSQESAIAHLVFNLTSKVEIENGHVTQYLESGPLKDHFNSNF